MTLDLLDCFYLGSILVIMGFVAHMEMQIRVLRTMMEEHVKCEVKLSEISKELKKTPSQNT
jgi:hypothetical protein